MVMPKKPFSFLHYGTSDKVGYPVFLHFRTNASASNEHLYVYIADDHALKLSICSFKHAYSRTPYQVRKLQNQEAYAYLLPIFQEERLRIIMGGYPIKSLIDHYEQLRVESHE